MQMGKKQEKDTYGLPQLLKQSQMLSAHSSVRKVSASTSRQQLDELLVAQVEQVLEVHSSVGKLPECPLLGLLGGL